MSEKIEALLQYMDAIKEIAPISLPGLIRDKGQLFRAAKLPKSVRKMASGECFRNSFHLMLENPGLIYVEGYGNSIIPTLHAWCIDVNGNVVDATWEGPEQCAYYGIPFRREFVIEETIKLKVYGLLSDYKVAYRISQMKQVDYLASEGSAIGCNAGV